MPYALRNKGKKRGTSKVEQRGRRSLIQRGKIRGIEEKMNYKGEEVEVLLKQERKKKRALVAPSSSLLFSFIFGQLILLHTCINRKITKQ